MPQLGDLFVRSLTPPVKGQRYYFDDKLKGFCCRISQGGTKTFGVIFGQDRRLVTIGRYPLISLADAREEAKRILAEHTLGRIRPQSITYASAVDLFLKDKAHARRPATVNSYRNKLARLKFRGQLSEITHAEAARLLDKIKAPSERSHVLVAAKVFFNWCLDRRYISDNPFEDSTNRNQRLALAFSRMMS